MNDYYISALASGGGDGTLGSPWTLDEYFGSPAGLNWGDVANVLDDGIHTTTRASYNPWSGPRSDLKGPDGGHATIHPATSGVVLMPNGSSAIRVSNLRLTNGASLAGVAAGTVFDNIIAEGYVGSYVPMTITRCESATAADVTGAYTDCFFGARPSLSNSPTTFTNCVSVEGFDAGSGYPDTMAVGCLALGEWVWSGYGYAAFSGLTGAIQDCLAVECSTGFGQHSATWDAPPPVRGWMEYAPGTVPLRGDVTAITEGVDVLTFNPFIDSANLDLRLTDEAKASEFALQLRRLMAGLVDVPKITTDSLEDLLAPALSNPTISGGWQ